MVESSISKRVIFLPGKQEEFIQNAKNSLGLTYVDIAQLLKISRRTLTDWKREKFSMSFKAVATLSGVLKKKLPNNIDIKDPYWYVAKSSRKGGIASYKKYGRIGKGEKHRKKKWYDWWENEGKHKVHPILTTKPIHKPAFSKDLAEFSGVILGDGSLTKYQLQITLHRENDKAYSKFAALLTKKLFHVPVGYHYRKDSQAVDLCISRRNLVHFCIERLGLVQGNKIKQNIDIPDWIKKNTSYSRSCIRGLFDTDGCIFTHSYKVNGKIYHYKKLCFTSYSKPLRKSIFNILKINGLTPRFSQNRDVRIDRIEDVKKYFQIIGSHNPKHLKKFQN